MADATIEDMNEYDRVKEVVSKWTPEQYSFALENRHDPKIAEAVKVFDQVKMDQALVAAKRESAFSPPVKGILGFKTLLPNWMGGNTINYEEPPQLNGESPADHKLRSELSYAQAYDAAKAQGIPIIRMRDQRHDAPDEMTNPANFVQGRHIDPDTRKWAGRLDNLTRTIPGLEAVAQWSMSQEGDEGRETAALVKRAGEEAPMAERMGIPLAAGLALPGVGMVKGAGLGAKVLNNPILRGMGFGGLGAGVEDVSQGASLDQTLTDMKYGAGAGGVLGGVGALGGKAASLINEGPLKEDLIHLRAAGGDTSITKGIRLPPSVEESLAQAGGAKPAARILGQAANKFAGSVASDYERDLAKFTEAKKGFLGTEESTTPIIPKPFADAVHSVGMKWKGVPGGNAVRSAVKQIAPDVFYPINLKDGTIIPEHDAEFARNVGWKVVSLDEAEALGLHVDEPSIERQPRPESATPSETEKTPLGPAEFRSGAWRAPPMAQGHDTHVDSGPIKLYRNGFVAILKPKPMDAHLIEKTEKVINGMVSSASENGESAVKDALRPLLNGLLESRDLVPPNAMYAPSSLKATVETEYGSKEVNGWSALNALSSQAQTAMEKRLAPLGVDSGALGRKGYTAQEGLTPGMEKAIRMFHRQENPRLDAALEAEAAKIPGGKQALYAVPAARAAEKLQAKAGILKNLPLGPLGFKPFFRAVGIHAEPMTSAMPSKTPGIAAAAGADGSDIRQLLEMADRLKEEAQQRIQRIGQ